MQEPIINLKEISFGYPGREPIFNNFNFTLNKGDRIGLVGPNGTGKTTMFHIIMGLIKPLSGTVELFGKEYTEDKDFRNIYSKIGLLFQDSDDQLFYPTVLEDVVFGPLNLGKSKEEALEIAKNTLNYLGLSGFEDKITHKLSGGEKRLISLASVLAMEPEVLLLDEPGTGLDEKNKIRLIEILKKLNLTFIVISHESDFLESLAEKKYWMEGGKIYTDKAVHEHIHRHPHDHIHKNLE